MGKVKYILMLLVFMWYLLFWYWIFNISNDIKELYEKTLTINNDISVLKNGITSEKKEKKEPKERKYNPVNVLWDSWGDHPQWVDMFLFCAESKAKKENNYLVSWFFVTKEWLIKSIVPFPQSWIDERQGWYGCLNATIRVWYCTYIHDKDIQEIIWWEVLSITMGAWNIEAEPVRNDREKMYRSRYWVPKSCSDFSEKEKYNQKYTIRNILNYLQNTKNTNDK